MKHLVQLYQNNLLVAFVCDGIAMLTGTTVVVFIIIVLALACSL